jgi:hypothetical protein
MATLHLRAKVIIGAGLGLLALTVPASVHAFMCPPSDQLGFGVGPAPDYQNDCGGILFCSYPAVSGENPNDFFCTYNLATGALIADNDAGLCQPSAPAGTSPGCPSGGTPTMTGTATQTATATATGTATTTATPTRTLVPTGGACSSPEECASGVCRDGRCVRAPAGAPALTPWGLLAAVVLLAGSGLWALRRRAS